jgi:5-methylcytosine-specific restriction endonuclease McrA
MWIFYKGVMTMNDVLLLNASYEPLRIVSIQRAMRLLLQQKAEIVEEGQGFLHTIRDSYVMPLVVRLVRYIAVPRPTRLACTRRALLMRDGETCQYCGDQPGKANLTLDHVVPRSQGGVTSWENAVIACKRCNHQKADRTPQQAGMQLLRPPQRPSYAGFALIRAIERHTVWSKYSYR